MKTVIIAIAKTILTVKTTMIIEGVAYQLRNY